MKKLILLLIGITTCAIVNAQSKIDIDTLRLNGKVMGITTTNWYAYEGDKMPSFEIISECGKTLKSEDLKGKTVVISFWINTCVPCMKELNRVGPEIIDQYPSDDFVFLAIGASENLETTKWFHEKSKATFDLYYDPSGTVMRKFADNGCPKVFVIDANGVICVAEAGYSPENFDTLKVKIRNIYNKVKK